MLTSSFANSNFVAAAAVFPIAVAVVLTTTVVVLPTTVVAEVLPTTAVANLPGVLPTAAVAIEFDHTNKHNSPGFDRCNSVTNKHHLEVAHCSPRAAEQTRLGFEVQQH
jgi:hypothetical protein